METFFTIIISWLIIGLIIHEYLKFKDAKYIHEMDIEAKKFGENGEELKKFHSENPRYFVYKRRDFSEVIYLIAGLFSHTLWPCSLAILILSLSKFQKISSNCLMIDSLLTITIFLYALYINIFGV